MNIKVMLSAFCASVLVASTAFAETKTHGEYDGNCAWGMVNGKTVKTDCTTTWTDEKTHKTYCFAGEGNKTEFAKDTTGNTHKADENWKKHHAAAGHDTHTKS